MPKRSEWMFCSGIWQAKRVCYVQGLVRVQLRLIYLLRSLFQHPGTGAVFLFLLLPEFCSQFSGFASLFHVMVLTGSVPGPKMRFSTRKHSPNRDLQPRPSKANPKLLPGSLSIPLPPSSPFQQNAGTVVLKKYGGFRISWETPTCSPEDPARGFSFAPNSRSTLPVCIRLS